MMFTLRLWTLMYLLGNALSARILVYLPSISPSHHFAIRPVLKVLAEKGHHITFFSAVYWKDGPPQIDQRTFNITLESLARKGGLPKDKGQSIEEIVKNFSPTMMASTYNQIFQALLEVCFEDPLTQNLIHSNEEYDMLISEAMRGMEGIAALQHRFNSTGVIFQMRGDNAWANELVGLPDNPAYMVDAKTGYSDHMNFWERLHNLYINAVTNWLSYQNLLGHQSLVDKYLRYKGWESRPPLSQLISDQALVLSNSHLSTGYAYPKASNMKEVGGTNVAEPKPLPQELEEHLNKRKGDLAFFSMGSNFDLNSPMMRADSIRQLFLSVFAKRKEIVFWKLSGTLKEKASDNVLAKPWYPQVDILGHNRTKFFITHGGMLSVTESVSQGVPIIGIPIFGDQKKNVLQAVNAGYGILLEIWNLTETSINWAMDEMTLNPSYKENAVKRAQIFYDRPMKPVDEAVYWIEYVLRNGKVLQPASAFMPFYKIYLLDIFGFVLLVLSISIWIVKKTLTFITGISRGTGEKEKSN